MYMWALRFTIGRHASPAKPLNDIHGHGGHGVAGSTAEMWGATATCAPLHRPHRSRDRSRYCSRDRSRYCSHMRATQQLSLRISSLWSLYSSSTAMAAGEPIAPRASAASCRTIPCSLSRRTASHSASSA